jgi:hypothetical protein
MHRDAEESGPKAALEHRGIGAAPRSVRARDEPLDLSCARDPLAAVEQSHETGLRVRARATQSEFDAAGAAFGLGTRSAMTDGESLDAGSVVQQHRVCRPVRSCGVDLAAQVRSGLHLPGGLAALAESPADADAARELPCRR